MTNSNSALHSQLVNDLDATQGNAALCVLSLDNLGRIAGEHGIEASEQATREFDDRISTLMRATDRKLVLAPDRVCVVFDELRDPNHTLLVALKIERSFEAPVQFDDVSITLRPRAGLVYCGSADDTGRDINNLYQHAETARELAVAQDTCFQIASGQNIEEARSDWNVDQEVERAILAHHLELFYQPQISLKDGSLVGLEALVRWHRDGSTLSPGAFIHLLSPTQMGNLTDYCLRTAMKDIADLNNGPPVSLNLDASTLQNERFLDLLVREAAIWHTDPSQLRFEVTETGVVADYSMTSTILKRFRDAGYRIAIDDFGTGYSSLQHFRTLPADEIKIDRCFVTELLQDPSNQHITQTIIDLAHRFGKTVVAEGIENEATCATLTMQGCDIGQGYHFGKPLDLAGTRAALGI